AFRTLSALAAPGERAGFIAAIYIVSYLAFSIPALIAGVATSRFGLHGTALVYCASIGALVTAAAVSFLFRKGRPSGRPAPAAAQTDLPPGPCTVPPSSDRLRASRNANPAGRCRE